MQQKKMFVYRALIIGTLILLQLAWFLVFLFSLTKYSVAIGSVYSLISIVAVLIIVNKWDNPAYKMAWVIPILIFPLFGGLMYVCFGAHRPSKKLRRLLEKEEKLLKPFIVQDTQVIESLRAIDEEACGQAFYLSRYADAPIYQGTKTRYFKSGEENLPVFLEELRKAKKFIFLEYFIIAEGKMWNSILEVLQEKVKEGVEVRLIYDDVGCLTVLPHDYVKQLRSMGIQCEVFNPFIPIFSVVMNNRDHRKILVIDGNVGFTGGINLADEYINEIERFGYWKDAGIMLSGPAVWNLTLMFLQTWHALHKIEEDISVFRPNVSHPEADGFVQPYGDNPLDYENVGENVYLNIINTAKRYVYIFTPYLIVDNEIITALCLAAKRGVDVRIVTPYIPDKKFTFALTQSYYAQLIEAGVKIFEFKPGFIHAKCFVSDDTTATVGTINLDYRSLYLHFECGVYMYRTESIATVYQDAMETFEKCLPITMEVIKERHHPGKLVLQAILRLLAPLF